VGGKWPKLNIVIDGGCDRGVRGAVSEGWGGSAKRGGRGGLGSDFTPPRV